MLRKKNERKTNDLPPPPEPEFFDEPKRAKKVAGTIRELLEKKWVRLVLVVLGIFILLSLFYRPSKKQIETPTPRTEERPVFVTPQAMERAIDSSVKGKSVRTPELRSWQNTEQKRKLNTSIAVFVDKPEKPTSEASSRSREGEMKLGIPAGTKIPALLSDRVFSFNVAAPITAVLTKDFTFQNKVVLPKDTKFLGEVNVLKSVDRINVRFDLLIFPDGRELRIRAIALSEDGSGGIKGKVDKHTDTKVLKAIGETLLAGASLFVGGRSQDPYSLEDQMRVNLSENLTNEASQDLRSVKVDKSITVESGVNIQVMLLEAV